MKTHDPSDDFDESPLIAHLTELRHRLLRVLGFFIVIFGICYGFSADIFAFLASPLSDLLSAEKGRRFIYTHLTEAFTTYLKVAFFAATFFSVPVAALEVWRFLAPGLYVHEKKAFFPFVIATPLLFFLGAFFAYVAIIPAAWHFFLQFETTPMPGALPIQLEARVGDYLSLVMQLLFAFGLCFLLPVLLVLLGRLGILTAAQLTAGRRYAFLGILTVSAIITPPDMISMLGLALPISLLYELSILLVKWIPKMEEKS